MLAAAGRPLDPRPRSLLFGFRWVSVPSSPEFTRVPPVPLWRESGCESDYAVMSIAEEAGTVRPVRRWRTLSSPLRYSKRSRGPNSKISSSSDAGNSRKSKESQPITCTEETDCRARSRSLGRRENIAQATRSSARLLAHEAAACTMLSIPGTLSGLGRLNWNSKEKNCAGGPWSSVRRAMSGSKGL
jgi:hypothetical protein